MKEYINLYQQMREDAYQKWGEYSHPESMKDFEKLIRVKKERSVWRISL